MSNESKGQGQAQQATGGGSTATAEAPRSSIGGALRGIAPPSARPDVDRPEPPKTEYNVRTIDRVMRFPKGSQSAGMVASRSAEALRESGIDYPERDVMGLADAIVGTLAADLRHEDGNLQVRSWRTSGEELWVQLRHVQFQGLDAASPR